MFRSRGGDPAKEREAYERSISQSEETFKKVGWKQIIITIAERGWFDGLQAAKIESALMAPFEDAVRLLSIENAKQ